MLTRRYARTCPDTLHVAGCSQGFPAHCNEEAGYKCTGMEDGRTAVADLAIVDYVKVRTVACG